MTKPIRPKILPTESSIQPLPSISPASLAAEITEVLSIKDAILTQVRHENRVRGECLEIAMEALGNLFNTAECWRSAGDAMAKVKARLAQLEPEEETR